MGLKAVLLMVLLLTVAGCGDDCPTAPVVVCDDDDDCRHQRPTVPADTLPPPTKRPR